jgi:6-phosphofructokinase 2
MTACLANKTSCIVTVTFSPCIDKTASVPSLIPEKKLRCSAPTLEPGGGGINVARAIKKLGGEAIAVYPAGGYTGDFFNHLLLSENIPCILIKAKEETRENIIIFEESTNRQYRFGMPGTRLETNEWQEMLERIEQIENTGYIVASGSLPPGVPVDILAHLARIARKKNARFIADTAGEALRCAIDEGLFMIKPNLAELTALSGKAQLQADEIPKVARKIIDEGKCEMIVISMGAEGAMLVTREQVRLIKPPAVRIKSTVGAGDSMVAGIVLSLFKGRSFSDATTYGVACGTAATINPGTQLCRQKDAEKLYAYMRAGQVAVLNQEIDKDYQLP